MRLVIAMLWCACAGSTAAAKTELRNFDSPAEALASLLAARPRVIAFGEYHEIKGAAPAKSAIAHFQEEMLEPLKAGGSDLIVETWVTEGNCGKQEKEVVAQVEETTQRPETTESEVVTLMKRAKAINIQPHILKLTCGGYQALLDDKGEVDYVKLLQTVTDLLRDKIMETLVARAAAPDKTILVYGGAIHNDVYPRRELAAFTFAPKIQKAVKGKYLEVDLYVPEYIDADKELRAEAWYAPLQKLAKPGKATLIRRGPSSYIIVFARGPKA
ncbi:MAG TPA: hypothetical protein VFF06_06740 [Polyangia bacterium]|nr:hypothetical protein [Polyangia bacterium]